MRIVHVVRQYAPSVGGLEAVVQRLATEQRSRLGHDVTVVTLDRLFADPHTRLPARETIDGIEVHRLAWAGSSRYPLCPQVVAHLDGADLVHVHAIDFFFDWLSLTRFVHRKPMIASTHGGFFHTAFASTLKKLWFDTITRFSSLGYRRIVATSDNDGAVFARVAGSRVVVVENGAEVARFRDAASASVVPTLLYFGRWSTNKGLLELLALMAELHRRDPAWRLIVAGRAFDLTRATLQAQIDALDLTGAVELHEGPSDDALRELMTRASYFACLSRHEGFGIAAIEAMSAGLVPILSDIPPFAKLVRESSCGIVLPAASVAAGGIDLQPAAAAVERLHRTVAVAPVTARQAMIRFTARYDWSAVVDRYDAVYWAVLETGGAVPRPLPH